MKFRTLTVSALLLLLIIPLRPTSTDSAKAGFEKPGERQINQFLFPDGFVSPAPRQHGKSGSHTLSASYYSMNDNLQATVTLTNQGPNSMPVNVSLFRLSGERFDLTPMTLAGNTIRVLNLSEHISAAGDFREGSVQITYAGGNFETRRLCQAG